MEFVKKTTNVLYHHNQESVNGSEVILNHVFTKIVAEIESGRLDAHDKVVSVLRALSYFKQHLNFQEDSVDSYIERHLQMDELYKTSYLKDKAEDKRGKPHSIAEDIYKLIGTNNPELRKKYTYSAIKKVSLDKLKEMPLLVEIIKEFAPELADESKIKKAVDKLSNDFDFFSLLAELVKSSSKLSYESLGRITDLCQALQNDEIFDELKATQDNDQGRVLIEMFLAILNKLPYVSSSGVASRNLVKNEDKQEIGKIADKVQTFLLSEVKQKLIKPGVHDVVEVTACCGFSGKASSTEQKLNTVMRGLGNIARECGVVQSRASVFSSIAA